MVNAVPPRSRANGIGWRRFALALAALALWPAAIPAAAETAAPKRSLTVADAIETRRAMSSSPYWWIADRRGELTKVGETSVFVSPDGTRFAMMLIRGDVERDGVWVEIAVGGLQSLESASEIRIVASLFTRALGSKKGGGSNQLILNSVNPIKWLPDNRRLSFFWEDQNGVRQIISVDAQRGDVQYLTHHATDVVEYAIGRNGAILYAARAPAPPNRSTEMLRDGFAVANADAYSLLRGQIGGDLLDELRNTQRFILDEPGGRPRAIRRSGSSDDLWIPLFNTALSPNGRFAIVDGTPPDLPASWDRYTHDLIAWMVDDARRNGRRSFGGRQVRQTFLVDSETGASRPFFNAPSILSNALWSPNGRSVLLAPAFLPADRSDAEGLEGRAVAEVDVATGRFSRLPLPAERDGDIRAFRWLADDIVEIERGAERFRFAKRGGAWRLEAREPAQALARSSAAPIRIELRQDLNSPPAVFAIGARMNEERMILDLNPQLRETFALGRVELIHWNVGDRHWSGLLYYPTEYTQSRRYPLVIQTNGHPPPSTFSLYGIGGFNGLGPGVSVNVAQMLANRGIAVLQLGESSAIVSGPEEAQSYMRACEEAIRLLTQRGTVDRARVGISGFSHKGWLVEYALTQSDFPFAAAISSDSISASYVGGVLMPGNYVTENGAAPFGEHLSAWLEHAPGFNADRIRTPLRLQIESAGLEGALEKWEVFARLRQLNLPVELFVVPDIDHGGHNLQNPRQVLASQQGAVDWFDFWLNGREDSDPRKAAQYERWRLLRELRDAAARLPRRPLLDWTASPRAN